jgi:hypothetical protein
MLFGSPAVDSLRKPSIGVSILLSAAKLLGVGIAAKLLTDTVGASVISASRSGGSARDFRFGLIEEGIVTSSSASTPGFSCFTLFLVMRVFKVERSRNAHSQSRHTPKKISNAKCRKSSSLI